MTADEHEWAAEALLRPAFPGVPRQNEVAQAQVHAILALSKRTAEQTERAIWGAV